MEKRKILLVDDDKDLIDLYGEVFQNANFDVSVAFDGVDGLNRATKEIPDVIFTGIMMPGMDGFSMIEALKKTVLTSNIPVVISSHMGKEEDKLRADELGAKDFIVRGTTRPVEVVQRINAIFERKSNDYVVEINQTDRDAKQLMMDLGFNNGFECEKCHEKMEFKLKPINIDEKQFKAQFICPKCG